MEKIQVFTGGMNSDISPVSQPEGSYVEAINIEILDDELQGSVAISNSKGNRFQLEIPDVEDIVKITFNGGGATNIRINNEQGAGTTISSMQDLYNYISTDPAYTLLGVEYNIYYTDLTLLIYPIPPFALYDNIPGTPMVAPAGTTIETSFVPASVFLKPIGYGIIRDDIYIFSTPSNDLDPKVNGGGYGYIWKLNYNNITFAAADASIELIYANDLSLSTYWNIPQTGVVGRFENNNIQRLYWTDDYNRLRSLNVADPQIGALDLTLVDVQPAVDFDVPLMTNIQSAAGTATINIGCYQLAYKLSNTSGASTGFSVPSNMIFVVNEEEENQTGGVDWEQYHGDVLGTTTTKRITWTINNVDTEFERIEAVLLVRETKNAVPTIYSVYEGPVILNSIEITIDGDIINEGGIVTLDEFTISTSVFTHAKTIGTKDNRLVAGNVRNETFDLDFDARAYRHKALNDFDIIEDGVVVNYPTADYTAVLEGSDAIAPFNLLTTDVNYDATSRFKADGVTLGGEGTYVSYEFVSIAVACDKTVEPINPQPLPIVSTNPDYTDSSYDLGVYSSDSTGADVLQSYPLTFPSSINDGMKYPQMNSIYWGYQHNEIYRIALEFYDKSKNKLFIKWIGDIKFPDYMDTCPAANNIYADGTLTGLTDYRKSFETVAGTHGSNEAYVCQLGLKLDINIPAALTSQISGYSIVRVKREEADKTVIAEGIVNGFFSNDGGATRLVPLGDMAYSIVNYYMDSLHFITPNVLDSSLTIPGAGMKLRCNTYLSASNALQNVNIVGGTDILSRNKLLKMYTHTALPPAEVFEVDIEYGVLQGLNQVITDSDLSATIANFSSPAISPGNGNPAYYIRVDSALSGAGITGTDKFFTYVYNPIINQYGGATFSDRANNEYIICSHFRSTKTRTSDYNDSSLIFGGDVTNDIMDEERLSVRWSAYPADHNSTTFFYPASSPVNRFLRHGRHPNTHLTDISTANDDRTDYFYNTVYSCQNDIISFVPEPDPFIPVTEYDNRFYISDIKINGELTDSWSIFQANNYWDVEGVYGPINSMLPLADKMYFWQDRAFGVIEINPRAVVTDINATTNSQLQVGTGLPLQRHDYISTVTGSKHQGSTIASTNALYWYDANLLKLMRYNRGGGAEPLSDIKGLFSYLSKNLKGEIQNIDKPTYLFSAPNPKGINGVVATFDNKKHRAIFTFHSGVNTGVDTYTQNSFTVCLNELKNSFTTFYSFTPRLYINDNKYIFSHNNTLTTLNDLYLHDIGSYGEFYGVKHNSYIRFIVNPNPNITKTFDNLMYDSQATSYDSTTGEYINFNDDTWTSIRVTNDYQNTDTQALILNSNIKRKERTWQLAIPRNRVLYTSTNSPNIYTDLSPVDKDFGERMKDKYIQVELTYDNSTDRELKTNNLTTKFRPSAR